MSPYQTHSPSITPAGWLAHPDTFPRTENLPAFTLSRQELLDSMTYWSTIVCNAGVQQRDSYEELKKTKTAETEDPSVLICPGWGRPIVGVRTYVSVNWSRNIPPLMEKRQTACEYPSKSMVLIHLILFFSDSNLKREVKSAIMYPSIQSKHLWSFSKELWNTANTPDCTERAPITANAHSCSP